MCVGDAQEEDVRKLFAGQIALSRSLTENFIWKGKCFSSREGRENKDVAISERSGFGG